MQSVQRLDLARRHGVHTVLPAAHTFIHELNKPSCIHFVSIHQMASPDQGGTHLDQLTTQFIDPDRMKCLVGLVGWHIVDVLPTSGHPTATKTGVLPLCNAANVPIILYYNNYSYNYNWIPLHLSVFKLFIHSTVEVSEKSCFEHKNA